jgi:EAL domain-containing protein (putative c-di-GMP-specific phosphodiesterase class I)
MPTLQDRIAAKFIETLEQSDAVSETQAKQIQGLLASGKTVKPDDIVAALKALESDGVK